MVLQIHLGLSELHAFKAIHSLLQEKAGWLAGWKDGGQVEKNKDGWTEVRSIDRWMKRKDGCKEIKNRRGIDG